MVMEKRHGTHPFIYFLVLILIALALFLMPKRVVSARDTKEARTGFVVENEAQRADVTIRYPDRKVEVKVIDRKKLDLPNSIQLSFMTKDGKRTDLEVSAIQPVPPAEDPKYKRDYRGVLPQNQDSYVGVELKIPLPKLKRSH